MNKVLDKVKEEALVLLSGGQDSCTCLAWAQENFTGVHTVSFFYGQKHVTELYMAKKLSELSGAASHKVIPINSFQAIGNTNLLEQGGNVNDAHPVNPALPSSFVPGRNLIFLTLAAAYAYGLNIKNLVIGVSEADYSGYPDCRASTIEKLNSAINLGLEARFSIYAPLINMTKAQEIVWMAKRGKLDWYGQTMTCYNGVLPGCGFCPACKLRAKAFLEAGVTDPLFASSISFDKGEGNVL